MIKPKESVHEKPKVALLFGLLGLAIFLWVLNWLFVASTFQKQDERGQFGDQFGSVNALFSGLAFAGLAYTILLQRHQLLLQSEEIREAAETQKRLFEAQKQFQDEQRRLQAESSAQLETARQKFQELLEEQRIRSDRKRDAEFTTKVLLAIKHEMDALIDVYREAVGDKLGELPDGVPLEMSLRLTQNFFTVYEANAVHLGHMKAEVSESIIRTYMSAKTLVEMYRMNNAYIEERADFTYKRDAATGTERLMIDRRLSWLSSRLIEQAKKIRTADSISAQYYEQFRTLVAAETSPAPS